MNRLRCLLMAAFVALAAANATSAAATSDMSSGRAFSLREAARVMRASGGRDRDAATLGGITRLDGFVVDEKNGDVVLFGQADPERPALHLENFVVALRNARMEYARVHRTRKGVTRIVSPPGCSIDGNPKVIARLEALTPGPEWERLCRSPQAVRVVGIPRRTRFAGVMVDADYAMKRVVDGTDDLGIEGFRSLNDATLDEARRARHGRAVPRGTFNRFWFYPGTATYRAGQNTVIVDASPCSLLTERQYVSRGRRVARTGSANPAAAAFCKRFYRHLDRIAAKRPIYAELDGLFRLTLIAKLLEKAQGMSRSRLGGAWMQSWEPEDHDVPRTLPGRPRLREIAVRGGTIQQSSCGGVLIDYGPHNVRRRSAATTRPNLGPTPTRLGAAILAQRPDDHVLAWNFSMTDIDLRLPVLERLLAHVVLDLENTRASAY